MKIIQIKKDALRLMGILPIANDQFNLADKTDYLDHMNQSILRSIDRMRTVGVLPTKLKTIQPVLVSGYTTLTQNDLGIDGELIGIISTIDNTYQKCIVKDNRLYCNLVAGSTYYVEYIPKIVITSDDDELDIPDALARIIPYFIKADLYEEEEPSLSANARNLFEKYLEEYQKDAQTHKFKVVHSFSS